AADRRGWCFGSAAAIALLAWDPAAPAADPKRALLLVVAAAALVWTPRRDRSAVVATVVELPAAAPPFLALAALAALSLTWGDGHGWRDLATLGAAALVLLAAALRPRAEAAAMARATASVLGGGAALWTLLEAMTGARGLALHGGQGNPNWLGLVLAVTLPLSLSALLREGRESRTGRVLALLVLPQIPALVLAQSRTAARCARWRDGSGSGGSPRARPPARSRSATAWARSRAGSSTCRARRWLTCRRPRPRGASSTRRPLTTTGWRSPSRPACRGWRCWRGRSSRESSRAAGRARAPRRPR